ncbi:acyl-CoA thioester hydrolase [Brevibacillus centrosporus]|uniref:Acyl-CoA thioester hydrolase n=1 Tax=Brevibacillus centrosporus TaxID=54910 RepID=A0A1I3L8U5_9BACL|nr:acyl-CoA thioester hydrolase [Brevibacillus centrosporus]
MDIRSESKEPLVYGTIRRKRKGRLKVNPVVQSHRLRVRYGETDRMGVVYHTNYLNWFEVGRTEFIRHADLTYRQLEEQGILLPLTDADISYKRPAKYDDEVEVRTHVSEISPVRLTFSYEIVRVDDSEVLVTGRTMHVFTNAEFKPIRLSRTEPDLYEWLAKQHAGVTVG